MHSLKRLSIQRIDHRSKVSILLIQANTKIHLSKEDRKILNELEKTLINSLTSIKLKIESNFYIWWQDLRAKNDIVFQVIVKKLNDFYLSHSFNLKVKSTKFIYFSSFFIQINNYRLKNSQKEKHAYRRNHSKSLNENNSLHTMSHPRERSAASWQFSIGFGVFCFM